jgi:hypothetical protein
MAGVYPYDASELAAISRLSVSYNGGTYNASTNPYGFGQGGHVVNFLPALQDTATAAQATSAAATAAASSASAAAGSATTAAASAAALQGTSATSNTVSTGAKSFTTQSGKSFDAGKFVSIYSAANPTVNYMGGNVTSYSGTALVVNVTAIGSGSGNTASDWVIAVSGAPGDTGTIGLTGPQGATPALQMAFSTATSASDPGNGIFKFDNAAIASITRLYIDNVTANTATISAIVDSWDDSTNTALRGTLYFTQLSDPAKWLQLDVVGAVTDSTGYRTVVVANGVGGALPDNGASVGIVFSRAGNKGSDGAGAGDMLSDVAVAVDQEIFVANGTAGKHFTSTGVTFGTSGANKIGKLDANVTYSGSRTFAATADFQQQFRVSGVISPTQIAANTDDYTPTGLSTANVLRLTTDASRNLTGITGGASGRILLLMNVGSNNLVLKDETTSTAANRFSFGADVTLGAKQSVLIWYDTTSSRWRLSHPFIAGASGHVVVYADGANTWSGPQSVAAKLDAQQDFYLSGDISPTQIAANQNDYNPTGLSTASVLRLNSDASRNITGIQGGADGRLITIFNVGSNNIVLQDANASSSAANRFAFGMDVTLGANQSISLIYDATSARWRSISLFPTLVPRVQKFTASGTYTPSTGMQYCTIECIGGGGGSAGVASSSGIVTSGGGGGSGSYSRLRSTAATIGASQTVTIGAGGTAGAAGANNGSAGGDTSVGTLCIGKGGAGGTQNGAGNGGAGGAGGVAGTGDYTPTGTPGGSGNGSGTNSMQGQGGFGGTGFFGGGGLAVFAGNTGGAAGNAGTANTGGGASGATLCNNVTPLAGAAGGSGVVLITEYCSQ